MILIHNFYLRYDVAKLMNMDYSNEVQKKLVDKIAAQLPCDDDWMMMMISKRLTSLVA